MTRQESFKKRVRARMARTGERYNAARRVLVEQAGGGGRAWVSDPEVADDRVRAATGRTWDGWCDEIDAWPGHEQGHAAVAAWLQSEHGVEGWWAQTVTVGWERITGRRLPGQMSDGTFAVNVSRAVAVDAGGLRSLLLDDGDRADLFGGRATSLRSRTTSKSLRFGMEPGVAEVAIDDRGDGRARVAVQHTRLPDAGDVDAWRTWWTAWLEALDEASPA